MHYTITNGELDILIHDLEEIGEARHMGQEWIYSALMELKAWRLVTMNRELIADPERFLQFSKGKPHRSPWSLDEWRKYTGE